MEQKRSAALYELCEALAGKDESAEDKAVTHYLRMCEMQNAIDEAKDEAETEVRREFAAKYPSDVRDPDRQDGDGSNAEKFSDFLNERLLFKKRYFDFDD